MESVHKVTCLWIGIEAHLADFGIHIYARARSEFRGTKQTAQETQAQRGHEPRVASVWGPHSEVLPKLVPASHVGQIFVLAILPQQHKTKILLHCGSKMCTNVQPIWEASTGFGQPQRIFWGFGGFFPKLLLLATS